MMRVLIIEDDQEFATLISDLLAEQGLRSLIVADGASGLRVVQTVEFDAILTDFALPHVDGVKIAKEARLRQPKTALYLVTGWPTWEPDWSIFDRVFQKPFHPDDFTEEIASLKQRHYGTSPP